MVDSKLKTEILSVIDYFNVQNNSQKELDSCLEYVSSHLHLNDIKFNDDEVIAFVKEYFSQTLNK